MISNWSRGFLILRHFPTYSVPGLAQPSNSTARVSRVRQIDLKAGIGPPQNKSRKISHRQYIRRITDPHETAASVPENRNCRSLPSHVVIANVSCPPDRPLRKPEGSV